MKRLVVSTFAAPGTVFRSVVIAALCLSATASIAYPLQQEVSSGIVVASDSARLVIDTAEGQRSFEIADADVVPAGLEPDDFVIVRLSGPDARNVEQVLVVDERVEVTAEGDEERAVLGTVTATSTDQLLVQTTTGEQAFVVNPEKLFPPLPTPEQRVAVTYRTLEVKPPRHLATGLVVLPDDLVLATGNVRVTSEPVPVQVAEAAPEPEPVEPPVIAETSEPAPTAPIPRSEPQQMEALPRTGTTLPLLLATGVLLVGLGIASRFGR